MVGQHIGSYRVLKLLGEGGIGSVYQAVHDQLGRTVAIKILKVAYSQEREMVKRLLNEARAVNLIRHPGIVDVTETGQTPQGQVYIVMEYLPGESLGTRLRQRRRLPREVTLRLGGQIAAALAAAHGKGIVHRDLKPDNVMIVADHAVPGGERTKLLDFGIAKVQEGHGAMSQVFTQTGALMGTPLYMSPEQCRGARQVDHKTDVYALGVMLFQMLAGAPPFSAEGIGDLLALHMFSPPPSIFQADPSVPGELARLLNLMLAKAPEARPAMAQVADALGRLQGLGPEPQAAATTLSDAPPLPTASTMARAAGQAGAMTQGPRRWPLALGAVIVAGMLGAGGYLLRGRPGSLGAAAPAGGDVEGAAARLLAEANGDLLDRRWDDAIAKSDQVLRLEGTSRKVWQGAQMSKQKAEQEKRSEVEKREQGVYDRFAAAAAGRRYDEALSLYQQLAVGSVYRQAAKETYNRIFPLFATEHLERAEQAGLAGSCLERQGHIERVLALEPRHVQALAATARGCPAAPPAKALGPAPPPAPGRPMRKADAGRDRPPAARPEAAPPGGPPADPDTILREAQNEYLNGNYQKAIELARPVRGAGGSAATRAWRIMGAAACNIRDLKLVSEAHAQLDPNARQFIIFVCQRSSVMYSGGKFVLAE